MSQFKGFRKKKDTTPNFLHNMSKNGVESEYDIHFGQILAIKIRYGFLKKITMHPGECLEKVQSSFRLHRNWTEHLKKRQIKKV